MNLIVNDTQVAVDQAGHGPVVLLLHGWGSSRQTFAALVKALKADYTVVAVDLPGFGASQLPKGPAWGIEDYVNFVAELLKKLKITEVEAVIGHSMGGRIAIQGFGRKQLAAKRLVLIGSHGIKQTQSSRNQLFKLMAKTGKIGAKALPASQQAKLKNKLYSAAGTSDYTNAGPLQEGFKKIIATDAQDDATNITTPTLLIYGQDDESTPVSFGRRFAELIADSRLEVINSAGHFVHEEAPDRVNSLIKDFIAE